MYPLEMKQYLPALPVFGKGEGTDIGSHRIEVFGDSRRIVWKWVPYIPEQGMTKSFHLPVRRHPDIMPVPCIISLAEKISRGFFNVFSKMKFPCPVQGEMVWRRFSVVLQGLFNGLKRHQCSMRPG
ncbi:hypothetical protein ES703_75135 [subsurface metagenome]